MDLRLGVGFMIGMCLLAMLVFYAAKKNGGDIKHITEKDGFRIVFNENFGKTWPNTRENSRTKKSIFLTKSPICTTN